MDLKNVLNDEDNEDNEDNEDASSAAPPHPSKRQPPPPLTTSRSNSSYNPSPHSNTFDSPQRFSHPYTAHSPGSIPPQSAQSYTSTPLSGPIPPNYQSPYQRNVPLPSPGPTRSGSLSNSYFAPGQRPSSHHSLHRISTSPLEPIAPFGGSPQLTRTNQPPASYPPQQLHPHAPLGPPPPIVRHDSSYSYDSPAPYQRHRSSSGTSYTSPSGQPRPLPSTARSTTHYQDPSPRRDSLPRPREQSVSVSPRTVVSHLPQASYQAETELVRSTSGTMARPAIDEVTTPQIDGMRGQTMHHSEQAVRGQSPPTTHGLKRSADVDPEPLEQKRQRIVKEPPIWAQEKRSTPGMKILSVIQLNGHNIRKSKSPQPSATAQPSSAQQQLHQQSTIPYNSIHDDSYERSFRNIVPAEDLTHQVASFLFSKVVAADANLPVEIEAKIGRLVERGTSSRIHWALGNEVILKDGTKLAFESQMSESHHKNMNAFLNECLIQSNQGQSAGNKPRIPLHYVHHREADSFYNLPPSELAKLDPQVQNHVQQSSRGPGPPRVRVTRDLQSGEVTAQVIKARIGDINVFCPNWQFDYRISVNYEFPWTGDVEILEEHAASSPKQREPRRNKDRLSYSHQFCRVDLTQVKVGVQPGGRYERMNHELEVEMDVQTARAEGQRAASGQPNHYPEYIKVFIDNVRTLAKTLKDE